MRKILIILLCVFPLMALSQVHDDFNDGDFRQNPSWVGDTGRFKVNQYFQLQSTTANTTDTSSLSTSSSYGMNTVWTFYIRMNFDPSSANQYRIYLLSDSRNLQGILNGYFLQIGESGASDSYDLYKQHSTTITKIIDGPPRPRLYPDTLKASIRISRDENGHWEVYTNTYDGQGYIMEGTTSDATYHSTVCFGIYTKATTSRSDKFLFDDLHIETLHPDTSGPELLSALVVDTLHLDLLFNEDIDSATAEDTNTYFMDNYNGSVLIAEQDESNKRFVHITLDQPLKAGYYSVIAQNIKDTLGNLTYADTVYFSYAPPRVNRKKDIVINEIFADPSPDVGLPLTEFIELFNTTNDTIDLKHWEYGDAAITYVFKSLKISPKEYLILCPITDTSDYQSYGRTKGINPFPSLNNSSDHLTLRDSFKYIIDEVDYSDTWYKNANKKEGGYTLELIDPDSKCDGITNWIASNDSSGGTPGKENSVHLMITDSASLSLMSIQCIDSITIKLLFSKSLDSTILKNPLNYMIDHAIGNPLEVRTEPPHNTSAMLSLSNELYKGTLYKIEVLNIEGCDGQHLPPSSANFIIPLEVKPNDILINEILFNPKPDGVDFIELYNHSNKIIDLSRLTIANTNDQNGINVKKNLSDNPVLIFPEQYVAISTHTAILKEHYSTLNANTLIEINQLPSFNDDKGCVVLLYKDSIRIDQFNYTEDMHYPLLDNAEGYSLERKSFNTPTQKTDNWTSASTPCGGATPGYKNSQSKAMNDDLNQSVYIEPETFSPDNDGNNDQATIHYHFPTDGLMANISIYNTRGILVRQLVKNELIGMNGSYSWDGLDNNRQQIEAGIYIVYFETFDMNGNVEKFKRVCVLAYRF